MRLHGPHPCGEGARLSPVNHAVLVSYSCGWIGAPSSYSCVLHKRMIKDQNGSIRGRVERGAHPDLTWVTASGASEMLVADIEEPVVAAATRTPFESSRRVFVIEGADTPEAGHQILLPAMQSTAIPYHLSLNTEQGGFDRRRAAYAPQQRRQT